MKYAIIKCINGNYSIHSEGITDVNVAKTQFHGLCQILWNAPDVITGMVKIMDENLDNTEGYREFITHPAPEPEPPAPEPEPEEPEEPEENLEETP